MPLVQHNQSHPLFRDLRQERLPAMKARHVAPTPTRAIGFVLVTYDVVICRRVLVIRPLIPI
jgi:hypothetical protein